MPPAVRLKIDPAALRDDLLEFLLVGSRLARGLAARHRG
jgi:hypothetical protein